MLKFAFSSNAFKNTDIFEATRQVADAGYDGIEVMADVPHAFPPRFDAGQRRQFCQLLEQTGLKVSNVNAFTYFADGDTYHPTFFEPDEARRKVRINHTIDALQLAADIGAPSISVQPGGPMLGTGLTRDQAGRRFADALDLVLPTARKLGVTITIEPEPGLFIQSAGEYVEFKHTFFADERQIAMNFDAGHLYCIGDDPADMARRYAQHIAHVHLEDIAKNRVHQHLMLGEGAMDLPGILGALTGAGYDGWVAIELYPYVANAGEIAQKAMAYLRSKGLK